MFPCDIIVIFEYVDKDILPLTLWIVEVYKIKICF